MIDKDDDIDTIAQKMLMNARDDSAIIKILEFRRKYEESARKAKDTIKQEDINIVIEKMMVVCLKYIPPESHRDFLACMQELLVE